MENQSSSKSPTAGVPQGTSGIQGDRSDVLEEAARRASHYLAGREKRSVFPSPEDIIGLAAFEEPLPEARRDPLAVLKLLDEVGSPATVTSTGGRYFGFVFGGTLPATLAANMPSVLYVNCRKSS